MCLEESDYLFEDERTKIYSDMKQLSLKIEYTMESVEDTADEIFETWAYEYGRDVYSRLEQVANIVLNCSDEDWDCLINYHRLLVLGKELDCEGHAFLDYFDVMLYMIADAPSLKGG